MLHVDEILFAVALGLGVCLVLSSAIGVSDLLPEPEIDADAEGASSNLSVLGAGRVPLVIVIMLLTLLFGGAGFVISPWFHKVFGDVLGASAALVSAATLSFGLTRASSRVLARILPTTESFATSKADLVGREATVVTRSARGDAVLRAIDAGGAELRVRCEAHGLDLMVGERVVLVAYDRARDLFEIEKMSVD